MFHSVPKYVSPWLHATYQPCSTLLVSNPRNQQNTPYISKTCGENRRVFEREHSLHSTATNRKQRRNRWFDLHRAVGATLAVVGMRGSHRGTGSRSPHICINSRESQNEPHGNPESDMGRHALNQPNRKIEIGASEQLNLRFSVFFHQSAFELGLNVNCKSKQPFQIGEFFSVYFALNPLVY